MDQSLFLMSKNIIDYCIGEVLPDKAVKKALKRVKLSGRVVLVAIGKAAYRMASVAKETLKNKIDDGVVVTKYGYSESPIDGIEIIEAGHPILDENSLLGAERAIDKVKDLTSNDTVLFLVSGGGSALFEKPKCSLDELKNISTALLTSGADIAQMNTIRKRLSCVKGGRFANLTKAHIYQIVLSDIIGDPLDMIASGPAVADTSTCEDAKRIIKKYSINVSEEVERYLDEETPKELSNVTTFITGSVKELCKAAEFKLKELGFNVVFLTDQLSCVARSAGVFLSDILQSHASDKGNIAFVLGGETVVKVTGNGKGGRNQEIALSSAKGISGIKGAFCFSVGSDGTDGPTDAAGGYVDYTSYNEAKEKGIDIDSVLDNNDSYNALNTIGTLIKTGATGTNVNDLTVIGLFKNNP